MTHMSNGASIWSPTAHAFSTLQPLVQDPPTHFPKERALESRVAELLESWVSKMTGDSDQTLHGLLNWFCCWIFPSVMEKVIVETSLRTFEVQVCLHIERHTWNENDLKNLKSQFKRKEFERQAIKHYFFLNFSRALHVDLFTAFF